MFVFVCVGCLVVFLFVHVFCVVVLFLYVWLLTVYPQACIRLCCVVMFVLCLCLLWFVPPFYVLFACVRLCCLYLFVYVCCCVL